MRKAMLLCCLVGPFLFGAVAAQAQPAPMCMPDNQKLLQELEACRAKPKPVKVKTKKKTPPPAPVPGPVCPKVEKGDRGEKGDKGDPGPVGPQGPACAGQSPVSDSPRLNLGLGVMGSAIWPAHNYAWGWGPVLQLRGYLNRQTELTVNVGLAFGADGAPWSPGNDRALLGQVAVTHYLRDVPWLGFSGGGFVENVGFKEGHDQVFFVGVTPGVVFRLTSKYVTWRTEIDGLVGGGSQRQSWMVVGGGVGSSVLMWNW